MVVNDAFIRTLRAIGLLQVTVIVSCYIYPNAMGTLMPIRTVVEFLLEAGMPPTRVPPVTKALLKRCAYPAVGSYCLCAHAAAGSSCRDGFFCCLYYRRLVWHPRLLLSRCLLLHRPRCAKALPLCIPLLLHTCIRRITSLREASFCAM